MPPLRSLDARIAHLAARQHGIFTVTQALRAGASRKMIHLRVRAGRWERLYPRVLCISGVPHTLHFQALAAIWACGPEAVASHATAALLWQMDGVRADSVAVSTPRRVRIRGICVYEAHDLNPADVAKKGIIPVTSAARTLIDLAGVLDRAALETALDDALRRGLVTTLRLRRTYERLHRSGRPGIGSVRELLSARPSRAAVPDSPLETRMLRLMKNAGLPKPALHHRVTDRGRTIAIVDLAYINEQIAIELDGYRYHHGRRVWQGDLTRMNGLTARGWRVLRFSYEDVERRPKYVQLAIKSALAGR